MKTEVSSSVNLKTKSILDSDAYPSNSSNKITKESIYEMLGRNK